MRIILVTIIYQGLRLSLLEQLPPEIQSFLEFTSRWTDKYQLQTKFKKHAYIFTLKEIKTHLSNNGSELVRIHISHKPVFYSIELQELISNNNRHTKYKTIYSIDVKGDKVISNIIKDTKNVLMKRIKISYKSRYPF